MCADIQLCRREVKLVKLVSSVLARVSGDIPARELGPEFDPTMPAALAAIYTSRRRHSGTVIHSFADQAPENLQRHRTAYRLSTSTFFPTTSSFNHVSLTISRSRGSGYGDLAIACSYTECTIFPNGESMP